MAPVRIFAYALGGVYLLVGIIGFLSPFLTGVSPAQGFIVTERADLLGVFAVNWLHNLVHILVGVAGLAAGRAIPSSRTFAQVIGWLFLLLGIVGFVVPGDLLLGILPLNPPDNVLHLLTGLVGLFFGYAPARVAEAPEVPASEERRRV